MDQPNPVPVDASEEGRFDHNIGAFTNYLSGVIGDLNSKGKTPILPILVVGAGALLRAQGKEQVIRGFIARSYLWWDSVRNKDETTFFQNAHKIFGELPEDHVKMFTQLFEAKDEKGGFIVNQDSRNEIWRIFGSLIKISIKYAYVNQNLWTCPAPNNSPNLDFQDQARLWGVSLLGLVVKPSR